jgi:ferredoxin--NADP+ reductase
MSEWVVITNKGFSSDDWIDRSVIEPVNILSDNFREEQLKKAHLKLGNDFQVETLKSFLPYLNAISIEFPSEKDGRGFSLARRLRQLGYLGVLRATGHVTVDQYRHASQSGFNQIAIPTNLAKRMPEPYWQQQIDNFKSSYSYQEKLQPVSTNSYSSKNNNLIKEAKNIQKLNLTNNGFVGTTVTKVIHWTDWLFSFRVARPKNFRFQSGEFVMIGLPRNNGKPLLRAYSIASPSWDDELEFYSIIIPNGPLTSQLQHISIGDNLILNPKATGTLLLDSLLPGKRLFMFASGTGIAPFTSLIRDPEIYEKFEQIILIHTCREVKDLNYGKNIVETIGKDSLIGEYADRVFYYPTVTRETFHNKGRITDLLKTGQVFQDLQLTPISSDTDRAMICGSLGLNKDIKAFLEASGLKEGARNSPAEFVLEKAFVGLNPIGLGQSI